MVEPLSIVASVVGIGDVCLRFIKFIHKAQQGVGTIDSSLAALLRDVESLQSILDTLQSHFGKNSKLLTCDEESDLWKPFREELLACRLTVEELEQIRSKITGNDSRNSSIPELMKRTQKYFRKYIKDGQINQLHSDIRTRYSNLQIVLAEANFIISSKNHSLSIESSEQLRIIFAEIQNGFAALRNQPAQTLAFTNEHFDVPQPVSSQFVGRQEELAHLQSEISKPQDPKSVYQRRFVVYGLGGSGKSQFCCKFAQDNQQSFWGVFWVDASTIDSAKDSYARIAPIGKVDPNERAAKAWLSGEARPWLLIIDNADDQKPSVETLIPPGERGLVLITTRNSELRRHGTMGLKFFDFTRLDSTASNCLLLQSAGLATPWTQSAYESATRICQRLWYLPLAIVHAGRTIYYHFCTIRNYISYFDQYWTRLRQARKFHTELDDHLNVYSSCELAFSVLQLKGSQSSKDAMDLLKVLAFCHRQRIQISFFEQAMANLSRESAPTAKQARSTNSGSGSRKSLSQEVKRLVQDVSAWFIKLGEASDISFLPRVLQESIESGIFSKERLVQALIELHRMSLISWDLDTSSAFSVHPLVHEWVRERPEMSFAEQAIWCQAASLIIAHVVPLPPLGNTEFDESLRRDIYPHVTHVRYQQQNLQQRILNARQSRWLSWPKLTDSLTRSQITQLVKYSIVYVHNGHFREALELQQVVGQYLISFLGKEDPKSIQLLLFKSDTHWALGEGKDARALLEDLLNICLKAHGKNHEDVIRIQDRLGMTYWQQGEFKPAQELHEEVVQKLTRRLGPDHPETLRALSNAARTNSKFFEFDLAIERHSRALTGLQHNKAFGETHLETLAVKDNLAMAYLDRYNVEGEGFGDLQFAHELESEVAQVREEKLGKEHGYTLWAKLNLARIKAAQGDLSQAEQMIRDGLIIAVRKLDAGHIGVLYGQAQLGNVLMLAERFTEAEEILEDVVAKHEAARKGHADQLVAIGFLIGCCQALEKWEKAEALTEEFKIGIRAVFGENSKWEGYFHRKYGSYRRQRAVDGDALGELEKF